MFSLVQFVFPKKTDADDLAVRGRPVELYGGPYCRFEVPERPDQLVPQDHGEEPPDEDDRELLESLTALYWFRRQEPLEDEE